MTDPEMTEKTCAYCDGTRFELRKRPIKGGNYQFVMQCLTCGHQGSSAVRRADIDRPTLVNQWDEGLAKLHENMRRIERIKETEQKRAEFFREHDQYLSTQEWRAKRALVMKRAQGICEGCQLKRATQVHHLSYEHWQNEFLWELVAICENCHVRFHDHGDA